MHLAVLCSHLFHTVSIVSPGEISPYDMEGLLIIQEEVSLGLKWKCPHSMSEISLTTCNKTQFIKMKVKKKD